MGEEPAPQEQDRFELKIMIFGIIGRGVKKFKVYPAKTYVNAPLYLKCLQETLLPVMKGRRKTHVFMQDGASAHTAGETMDFLQRHNIPLLDWPPTSPDLNPIENFWAYLKHKMGYFPPILNKNKANVEKLRAHIQQTIDSIPQHEIDKFVDDFPYRLKACTLLGGKYVQHRAGRKLIAELKERERLAQG
jgi:transposase